MNTTTQNIATLSEESLDTMQGAAPVCAIISGLTYGVAKLLNKDMR